MQQDIFIYWPLRPCFENAHSAVGAYCNFHAPTVCYCLVVVNVTVRLLSFDGASGAGWRKIEQNVQLGYTVKGTKMHGHQYAKRRTWGPIQHLVSGILCITGQSDAPNAIFS